MPATIPTPLREHIMNYPPAQAEALLALYNQGLPFWLSLPVAYSTADAETLYTVPAGIRLFLHRLIWEATTGFTGGSSSAIGVSSDATGFTTKGDLLGGSGGDVTATLGTSGSLAAGTIGAKFGSNGAIVLPAGKLIRFDRITSAYTAGAGFVHVLASILPES